MLSPFISERFWNMKKAIVLFDNDSQFFLAEFDNEKSIVTLMTDLTKKIVEEVIFILLIPSEPLNQSDF